MTNSNTPSAGAHNQPPSNSQTSSTAQPTGPSQAAEERQIVAELAAQIAGPDPLVETYLQKVGRHNMARLQASEIVRNESGPRPHQTSATVDADSPLPPDLPSDPTHPLNSEADRMSDQEYQSALAQWQATDEYQIPLRQYRAWERSRSS